MKETKFKIEEGVCPHCGENDLSYDPSYIDESFLIYKWTCPQCKNNGKEYYSIVFAGHNITVGDEEVILKV